MSLYDEPPTTVAVQYFGALWDAPFLTDGCTVEKIATPLGTPCLYCHEPITAGDRGLMRLVMSSASHAELCPAHAECDLRALAGSPAHLRGQCSCEHTGPEPDDNRGWREQARETVAIINSQRAEAGHGPLW